MKEIKEDPLCAGDDFETPVVDCTKMNVAALYKADNIMKEAAHPLHHVIFKRWGTFGKRLHPVCLIKDRNTII